jgi:hypothetical protein
MLAERPGQVWLYHGGAPLRELLQPHGYKEPAEPLENLEHDELHSSYFQESRSVTVRL